MNGVALTPEEITKLYALKASGLSTLEIALALGKKYNTILHRIYWDAKTPEERELHRRKQASWRKKRTTTAVIAETVLTRPTPEMIRDRDIRALMPHRDLTAILCGDPPVGMSALEGRR